MTLEELQALNEDRNLKQYEYLNAMNATSMAGSYRIKIEDTTKAIEEAYEEYLQADIKYQNALEEAKANGQIESESGTE